MIGIAKGVAHVSFPGGGIFVPARSPYDRQLLAEHVLDRVRMKGNVQVLVDDQRWLVHLLRGNSTADCWRCGCTADSICYCAANDAVTYCVRCAFALRGKVPNLERLSAAKRPSHQRALQRQDSAA